MYHIVRVCPLCSVLWMLRWLCVRGGRAWPRRGALCGAVVRRVHLRSWIRLASQGFAAGSNLTRLRRHGRLYVGAWLASACACACVSLYLLRLAGGYFALLLCLCAFYLFSTPARVFAVFILPPNLKS